MLRENSHIYLFRLIFILVLKNIEYVRLKYKQVIKVIFLCVQFIIKNMRHLENNVQKFCDLEVLFSSCSTGKKKQLNKIKIQYENNSAVLDGVIVNF